MAYRHFRGTISTRQPGTRRQTFQRLRSTFLDQSLSRTGTARAAQQSVDPVNALEDVQRDVTVDVSFFPSQLPTVEVLRRPIESTTYASKNYQTLLERRGITCSMSRRGNCYDHAAMELVQHA